MCKIQSVMKKLYLILILFIFSLSAFAQPKIKEKYHKKDAYTSYELVGNIMLGGGVKTSKEVDYVQIYSLSYNKYDDGRVDDINLNFVHRGYESYCKSNEVFDKNFSIVIAVQDDTLELYEYGSTYGVTYVTTINGEISTEPDRYSDYVCIDISTNDFGYITSFENVFIYAYGNWESVPYYFTKENLETLRYFLSYIEAEE